MLGERASSATTSAASSKRSGATSGAATNCCRAETGNGETRHRHLDETRRKTSQRLVAQKRLEIHRPREAAALEEIHHPPAPAKPRPSAPRPVQDRAPQTSSVRTLAGSRVESAVSLIDHYVIRDGRVVRVPVENDEQLIAWAREFERCRLVKQTELPAAEVRVSTIFLGIDHNFSGGTPILFETMVFGPQTSAKSFFSGKAFDHHVSFDEFTQRHHTLDEALAEHDLTVNLVKDYIASIRKTVEDALQRSKEKR